MDKVGKDGAITVEEAKGIETTLEVVEGMQFDRGYISALILVTNAERHGGRLDSRLTSRFPREEDFAYARTSFQLLEQVAKSTESPLLIIADDVEGEASRPSSCTAGPGPPRRAAVKAPGFGDRRKSMLEDIAIFTGGRPHLRGPRH